ncbi:MAG: cytochrome c [Pirellula sp.]|nr:cytochrome c [Pirellula sp.]
MKRLLQSFASRSLLVATAAGTIAFTGCEPYRMEQARFEPNYLYAKSLELDPDVDATIPLDKPLADTNALVDLWFGTLDEPKIPPLFEDEDEDFSELLSLDKLKVAAGPPAPTVEPGETGLYRQLCASCHGETGQGRGPVAASQNPYPREFRHGWFKYKSTERMDKPMKSDIARLLRQGLADSQMPRFANLKDEQIDALVDYVVYLAIRGEFERSVLLAGVNDLDLEKERIYNADPLSQITDEQKGTVEEQLETASGLLGRIARKWTRAQEFESEIERPAFPLFGNETEENKAELVASIERGKQLFVGDVAACAKCHGPNADGNGIQTPDFDDWTKDWTTRIRLNPLASDALLPLMARGGLKPQPLKPRNLIEGHFRGGREPEDLYQRIKQGIPHATMPAAAMAASEDAVGLTEDDVWHLVNYILSIAKKPVYGEVASNGTAL